MAPTSRLTTRQVPSPSRSLLGDEAELYFEFNPRLVRTVQKRVDASRDTVDDACAFAWVQLMRWQPDRDRNWRSWLITTAEREVWRLTHEEGRTVGFEVRDSDELEYEPQDPCDRIQERTDLRHALDLLSAVPERRRQAKALHVMGYSYDEIRGVLGISLTRVNQLIAEANAAMRREQFRIGADQQPRSPRAARLRELEEEPPVWLCASIGRPPSKTLRAEAVLAWRRARWRSTTTGASTRPGWTTTRFATGRLIPEAAALTISPAARPSARAPHARSAAPAPSTGRGRTHGNST